MNRKRAEKYKSKTIKYQVNTEHSVYYGEEKYTALIISILVVPIILFVSVLACIDGNYWFAAINLPLVLFVSYLSIFFFRFRIDFRNDKKEFAVRQTFGGFKKIQLDEITEFYKKSDGKADFLHIKTEQYHIRVNTSACKNVHYFEAFLHMYIHEKYVSKGEK